MKNLKLQICRVLACAAVLALPLAHAGGVTVYDNGAPDHQSGNNMNFAWQADDFVLGAGTSVTGVSFWSLEATNAWRGSISWSIMSDASGTPGGTVVASGTVSSVTRTGLGSFLGLDEFRNDFVLSAPLALDAGTYWLVLHNGSATDFGDTSEFLWETTALNGSTPGMEMLDGTGPWTGNFNEHAFLVSAVPEPASVLMLAAGLLLAGYMRRRDGALARFGA